MASLDNILNETNVIYVFGYGSLTWKPDFSFDRKILGYIKGYERRFWQGSTYHRGTEEKPGRCLTLTKIDQGICYGLVYEIRGPEKITEALDYLNIREQALGGYEVFVVPVYPINECDEEKEMYSVVYVATPECNGFLGDGTVQELAKNIATSCGKVGHNIEYLFRLTDFMVEYFPNENEEHLYSLDKAVRVYVGLSPSLTPWKKLLEDKNFKRIVKPFDYKAKWKNAIKEMMINNRSVDRWRDLLYRINQMKENETSELDIVNLAI